MKICLIPPINKSDYLTNTVIDGLLWLKNDGSDIELVLPSYEYPCPYDISSYKTNGPKFMEFARQADLILLCWGKGATNYELADKIDRFEVTVFIDGSELGKDRRYDPIIRNQVEDMIYEGGGAIDRNMLVRSALYFRREKPYVNGIIPLPFGIESRYLANYQKASKNKSAINKDIDFACIFGQEDFPLLRRDVRVHVEEFSKDNGFVCAAKKTKGFSFDDDKKKAGRDNFYDILSRSKVGISIGGGGFDTARFWEILGNNCILLTENIDIFETESKALDYKRIWQFKDLADFDKQLSILADYLKKEYAEDYRSDEFAREYQKILKEHSTKARVLSILEGARAKGIIGQVKAFMP